MRSSLDDSDSEERSSFCSTRGSRLIKPDVFSLSWSKALYDSQVTPRATTVERPPLSAGHVSSKVRSGFEIRFVTSSGPSRTHISQQRARQLTQSYFHLPPISLSNKAVGATLDQKTYQIGLHTLAGEEEENEYAQSLDGLSHNMDDFHDAENSVFVGELKIVGEPYIDWVTDVHLTKIRSSIMANISGSSTGRSLDVLWEWPWLQSSDNAHGLYANHNVFPEPKNKRMIKPRNLRCPISAFSFKRYLESTEPMLSPAQYKETRAVVGRFARLENPCLHLLLQQYAESRQGWVKATLPNHSFCYNLQEAPLLSLGVIAPFCHDVWPEKDNSMLYRAVIIVKLAAEFWDMIRTNSLNPIEDEKGNRIEMDRFLDLFSSTTLPGQPKASKYRFIKTVDEGEAPCHIVVMYKGETFVMNVVDEDNKLISIPDITKSIKGLIGIMDAESIKNRPNIALLTSSNMTSWFEERLRLKHLGDNKAYFSEIENALFVLSLDHMNVRTLDQLANEALFGEGCNRWYDKGLSFYVHKNGFVTLNINSKILDGSTVAFLLHYMHLRIIEELHNWESDTDMSCPSLNVEHQIHGDVLMSHQSSNPCEAEKTDSGGLSTETKLLQFTTDKVAEELIELSARVFTTLSRAVLTSTCKLDNFDSEFFSKTRINKDMFAIMALHLTFFTMHYRPASFGWKLCLRKFNNLRHGTVRATTRQIVNWCKAFMSPDIDDKEKKVAFWKAHDMTLQLLREALNGKEYDNHLNALRNMCQEKGVCPQNDMFEDPGFFLSGGGDRYEILARSLGVGCTSCPVLLPCNPKGYGVGFCAARSFLMFSVTSWEEEAATCAPLFTARLKQTCEDMLTHFGPQSQHQSDVQSDTQTPPQSLVHSPFESQEQSLSQSQSQSQSYVPSRPESRFQSQFEGHSRPETQSQLDLQSQPLLQSFKSGSNYQS